MTINKKLQLFLVLTWLSISHTYATPTDKQLTDHLKVVGQGHMSWLFIDLYQATLYSATGTHQTKLFPQALNINYKKDIKAAHLISATQKEWSKLSIYSPVHEKWLTQLTGLWPNIKKGDQLLFLVESNGLGYFYHNNQLLGGIKSQQFSEDFLAIWLSQKSSEPKLRAKLLGE